MEDIADENENNTPVIGSETLDIEIDSAHTPQEKQTTTTVIEEEVVEEKKTEQQNLPHVNNSNVGVIEDNDNTDNLLFADATEPTAQQETSVATTSATITTESLPTNNSTNNVEIDLLGFAADANTTNSASTPIVLTTDPTTTIPEPTDDLLGAFGTTLPPVENDVTPATTDNFSMDLLGFDTTDAAVNDATINKPVHDESGIIADDFDNIRDNEKDEEEEEEDIFKSAHSEEETDKNDGGISSGVSSSDGGNIDQFTNAFESFNEDNSNDDTPSLTLSQQQQNAEDEQAIKQSSSLDKYDAEKEVPPLSLEAVGDESKEAEGGLSNIMTTESSNNIQSSTIEDGNNGEEEPLPTDVVTQTNDKVLSLSEEEDMKNAVDDTLINEIGGSCEGLSDFGTMSSITRQQDVEMITESPTNTDIDLDIGDENGVSAVVEGLQEQSSKISEEPVTGGPTQDNCNTITDDDNNNFEAVENSGGNESNDDFLNFERAVPQDAGRDDEKTTELCSDGAAVANSDTKLGFDEFTSFEEPASQPAIVENDEEPSSLLVDQSVVQEDSAKNATFPLDEMDKGSAAIDDDFGDFEAVEGAVPTLNPQESTGGHLSLTSETPAPTDENDDDNENSDDFLNFEGREVQDLGTKDEKISEVSAGHAVVESSDDKDGFGDLTDSEKPTSQPTIVEPGEEPSSSLLDQQLVQDGGSKNEKFPVDCMNKDSSVVDDDFGDFEEFGPKEEKEEPLSSVAVTSVPTVENGDGKEIDGFSNFEGSQEDVATKEEATQQLSTGNAVIESDDTEGDDFGDFTSFEEPSSQPVAAEHKKDTPSLSAAKAGGDDDFGDFAAFEGAPPPPTPKEETGEISSSSVEVAVKADENNDTTEDDEFGDFAAFEEAPAVEDKTISTTPAIEVAADDDGDDDFGDFGDFEEFTEAGGEATVEPSKSAWEPGSELSNAIWEDQFVTNTDGVFASVFTDYEDCVPDTEIDEDYKPVTVDEARANYPPDALEEKEWHCWDDLLNVLNDKEGLQKGPVTVIRRNRKTGIDNPHANYRRPPGGFAAGWYSEKEKEAMRKGRTRWGKAIIDDETGGPEGRSIKKTPNLPDVLGITLPKGFENKERPPETYPGTFPGSYDEEDADEAEQQIASTDHESAASAVESPTDKKESSQAELEVDFHREGLDVDFPLYEENASSAGNATTASATVVKLPPLKLQKGTKEEVPANNDDDFGDFTTYNECEATSATPGVSNGPETSRSVSVSSVTATVVKLPPAKLQKAKEAPTIDDDEFGNFAAFNAAETPKETLQDDTEQNKKIREIPLPTVENELPVANDGDFGDFAAFNNRSPEKVNNIASDNEFGAFAEPSEDTNEKVSFSVDAAAETPQPERAEAEDISDLGTAGSAIQHTAPENEDVFGDFGPPMGASPEIGAASLKEQEDDWGSFGSANEVSGAAPAAETSSLDQPSTSPVVKENGANDVQFEAKQLALDESASFGDFEQSNGGVEVVTQSMKQSVSEDEFGDFGSADATTKPIAGYTGETPQEQSELNYPSTKDEEGLGVFGVVVEPTTTITQDEPFGNFSDSGAVESGLAETKSEEEFGEFGEANHTAAATNPIITDEDDFFGDFSSVSNSKTPADATTPSATTTEIDSAPQQAVVENNDDDFFGEFGSASKPTSSPEMHEVSNNEEDNVFQVKNNTDNDDDFEDFGDFEESRIPTPTERAKELSSKVPDLSFMLRSTFDPN